MASPKPASADQSKYFEPETSSGLSEVRERKPERPGTSTQNPLKTGCNQHHKPG